MSLLMGRQLDLIPVSGTCGLVPCQPHDLRGVHSLCHAAVRATAQRAVSPTLGLVWFPTG